MENKYRIIDTHAHYDDEAYDEDRAEVLKQIKEAGVEQLMNIACSKKSIETTNNLTLEYDFIYGALGIHPSDADDYNEEVRADIISKVKSNKKILAIGEIGLDYYWDENPDREVQKFVFREQMRLAEELNLPHVVEIQSVKYKEDQAGKVEVVKKMHDTSFRIACATPAVLSVNFGCNEPRLATLRSKRAAKSKPLVTYTNAELGFAAEEIGIKGSPTVTVDSFQPETKRSAKMLTGTPAELAKQLYDLIEEEKGK